MTTRDQDRAVLRAAVWSCLISPVGLVLSVMLTRTIRADGRRPPALLQFALWNSILGLAVGAVLIAMLIVLLMFVPPPLN